MNPGSQKGSLAFSKTRIVRDSQAIPVIDLFAGPGGLGEGFSAFSLPGRPRPFRIALSIEMEDSAHKTLELRSFFRQFPIGAAPIQYYAHLRGEITRDELFCKFPDAAKAAREEAWKAELGVVDSREVDRRIRVALGRAENWILCGGPPCQAFSCVGRSRNGGIAEDDHRVYLYKQYLRILSVHEPSFFIIENVKGLLSSAVGGNEMIFDQMLADLRHPGRIVRTGRSGAKYTLHSLVMKPESFYPNGHPRFRPADFIIKSEDFGIPQLRHRVIILGVREDMTHDTVQLLEPHAGSISAKSVLRGLPRLRSGLTRSEDGQREWREAVTSILSANFLHSKRNGAEGQLREYLVRTVRNLHDISADRGGEFVACIPRIEYEQEWFLDPALGGVCNHSSRLHMPGDLHRYLFAACYARIQDRSPELKDFPSELHPDHKSLKDGLNKGHFDDRFRVQMANRPATTITSHIAKDGHSFIHYDETQCRSLTVREAARLQTFPDNYFFCGPRTHQYRQVGNAVPPLLALQIARLLFRCFEDCP
jgi:DNA (cytosine-5)-methyltransferase 1